VSSGSPWRRRLAASRFAPLAALPGRTRLVLREDTAQVRSSFRWLVHSREHTNFTYDLQDSSLEHLAWFVSAAAGQPVSLCRGWISEVLTDQALEAHVENATRESSRRGLSDDRVRLGRRAGWYALVRASRPEHVVETGTEKGLGSVVLAAALLRNGSGRLTTVDLNPEAGFLIGGPYAEVTTRLCGDALAHLRDARSVDLFVHDSDNSPPHETAELEAIQSSLTEGAVVLSDNDWGLALPHWAERTGRRYLYFGDKPKDHWRAGEGMGVAWMAG
jgi:hypothetical protein